MGAQETSKWKRRMGPAVMYVASVTVIGLIALGAVRIGTIERSTPRAEGSRVVDTQDPLPTAVSESPAPVGGREGAAPASPSPSKPARSLSMSDLVGRELTGYELYVVDPKTLEVTLLLAAPGHQVSPEVSPDGSQVAYVSGGDIFVREADGSRRLLTDLPFELGDPAWSPDGSRISFAGGSSDWDIFVINSDGSGLRKLLGTRRSDSDPDWSPDGRRIVFQGGRSIWTVSVAGGRPHRLTRPAFRDQTPAWSPNGSWIAFVRFESNHLETDSDLWLMRPDGSQLHRVLARERDHHNLGVRTPDRIPGAPAWSADGGSIAFDCAICSFITILNVETERRRQIPVRLYDVDWLPDGTFVGSTDAFSEG